MPNPNIDLTGKIQGWGTDLDPSKRPGVPREKNADHVNPAYVKNVSRQVPLVKIFQTIERPELTPVFGSTCPPRGLSGMLRHSAYTLSEGRLTRWLTLYFADRVDVVESAVIDFIKPYDVKKGKPAYNRAALAFIGVGMAAVAGTVLARRRMSKRLQESATLSVRTTKKTRPRSQNRANRNEVEAPSTART